MQVEAAVVFLLILTLVINSNNKVRIITLYSAAEKRATIKQQLVQTLYLQIYKNVI